MNHWHCFERENSISRIQEFERHFRIDFNTMKTKCNVMHPVFDDPVSSSVRLGFESP